MNESNSSYYQISALSAVETLNFYPQIEVYARPKGHAEVKRVYKDDILSSHGINRLSDLLNNTEFYLKY